MVSLTGFEPVCSFELLNESQVKFAITSTATLKLVGPVGIAPLRSLDGSMILIFHHKSY